MNHICGEKCDCKARMDAAMVALTLSSAHLKRVIFSGSDNSIESAHEALRVARVGFLSAVADYWRVCRARQAENCA